MFGLPVLETRYWFDTTVPGGAAPADFGKEILCK